MMNKEYVSVNDFHYKGYNIDGVGDGDSFCYCPCDIYGTPKLFYGDCHFSCGSEAFDYILSSFNCHNPYAYFDDDEVNYIIEDMWLSSCGRGRLFFGKYLVVDDGHLPTKEYVKDAIDWLNGNPRNYAIAYNTNNGVEEINCMEFLNGNLEGENDKPIKMDVPKEIQDLYSEIISRREYSNNKFPKNMTRAEYYSLIRQENKERKSMKKLIRLTEQDLHRIVKESVNKILNEVQFGGESLHGNNPEDWMKVSKARKRNALDALNGDEEYDDDDERAPYLNKNYGASSRDEINAGRICVDKFIKLRPRVYRYNGLYASQANKVFNRGMGSLAFVNFLVDEKTILVNKVLANKKDIELIKNNFPEWKIEFVSLGYPDWYSIRNLKACRGK